MEEHDHNEVVRQGWVNSGWPTCQRFLAHFEKKNWELLNKEFPPSDRTSTKPRDKLADLYNAIQAGFSKFTLNSSGKHQRVRQRLTLAQTISPNLYKQLAKELCISGRILRLWKEIQNVRQAFVTNYNVVQPLLRMNELEQGRDLRPVSISDKRFDALRQLYIDCFDCTCRLLVIAVGIETIIHEKSLRVQTKNGSIPLEQFEQLSNGAKLDYIRQYPVAELFLPALDTDLRPGIRHHAAYYDARMDQVVFHHVKAPHSVRSLLPYAEFCSAVTKLFTAFELATTYHHVLHLSLDGRLS